MAAPHRFGSAAVTKVQAGFLSLLRRLEREAVDKPRIGRSHRLAEDIVDLGQDPDLGFPGGDFADAPPEGKHGRPHLRAQFMGLFGPNGALPLNTTEEVLRWKTQGEPAFVRFADVFAARYLQLFFRAWSDSRAISQHDRPDDDRFASYVAAVSGNGAPSFRDHDRVPDLARLPLVSIFGGRVRSAVRLRQMLQQYFSFPVQVDEHVPTWLEFDAEDMRGLGKGGALGRDMYLGSRVRSVNEKICLHLHLPDVVEYQAFLPGQRRYQQLSDIVFWYLGKSHEVDLALSLPPDQIPSAQLGQSLSLGWLAAMKPDAASPRDYIQIARFQLNPDAERDRGPA